MAELKEETPKSIGKTGSYTAVLDNEFRSHVKYMAYWILAINAYFLMAVSIYPGEEAVQSFLGLFEEEIFQAFLGSIDGDAPAYRIWISMMLPFIVVTEFIYALLLGVRLAVESISDETGELIHTQPLQRFELLGLRFLVGVAGSIAMVVVSAVLLAIPVSGETVPVENIITYSWWGVYFLIGTLTIGMLFGTIAADTGRGNMFALIFGILNYALQATARVLPDLEEPSKYIPLNWYQPGSVILSNEIADDVIIYISLMAVLGITLSVLIFTKRDLIQEAAITIPLFSRLSRGKKSISNKGGNSDRDRLLVRWARPFEKRLPFTADFIYSERRALLIVFWALIIFYPAQLMTFQPDDQQFLDTLQGTINSFGNAGIMKVFTYGHDLSQDLWLWFLITQAVGNHYFILLPMTAHWIRKILLSDTEELTGEIYGSIPVQPHSVMLQRLFAVLLELLFIVGQMVLWLLVSENAIGIDSNQQWEVIAILSVIPLYIFLIAAGLTVGLLMQDGVKYARLGLLVLILWFVAGILLESNSGIFGLYDPVLIITEESLLVANNGVIWLLALAIVFSVLITGLASKYQWLKIAKADTKKSDTEIITIE